MSTGFLRDKHNILKANAPAKGINSVFEESIALSASSFLYASGTAFLQPDHPNRDIALYARVPGMSAQMRPSMSLTATGYSYDLVIAQAFTDSAHIMAYPNFQSGRWIPTAR